MVNQRMPLLYVKLYTYQICRALAYIHNCIGLCHLDIKPQNLLIYSQCNIYEAGQKKKTFEYYTGKAADKEEAMSGLIRSEGDLFLKGAQACLLTGVGGECVFHPSEFYPAWTMETASDSLKTVLQVCSGWQSLARPPEQGAVA